MIVHHTESICCPTAGTWLRELPVTAAEGWLRDVRHVGPEIVTIIPAHDVVGS